MTRLQLVAPMENMQLNISKEHETCLEMFVAIT